MFDEADKLLEDDFMTEIRAISEVDGFPTCDERQTMLFSATFPEEVHKWASDWLKKENAMVSF